MADKKPAPAVPAEAPTGLDALAGAAAAADAAAIAAAPAAVPDPNAPPEEPPTDYATAAMGAVDMFAGLVCGYAPAAATIWTEPTKARVAAAMAPVMEKYGFTLGNMPPELVLIVVAGPPLFQSSRLVAAQIAADKGKAAERDKGDTGAIYAEASGKPGPTADGAAAPAAGDPPRHAQEALYR